jgi:hypothetical protein
MNMKDNEIYRVTKNAFAKKKHVFPIDFKITKEDGKLEW